MELNVSTFSSTDVAVIKRMFTMGICIDHLGMHAIFSDSDIISSSFMFAISKCLMFIFQMYELNKLCMVPGLGMKTLSYYYLYSSSRYWHLLERAIAGAWQLQVQFSLFLCIYD
jgi:hypothetical protein